jgi:hypothetical protein
MAENVLDTASLSFLVPLWKKCLSTSLLERRWVTFPGARDVVLSSVKGEEVSGSRDPDIKITLTFSAVPEFAPPGNRPNAVATRDRDTAIRPRSCEIILFQVSDSAGNACVLILFRGVSSEQRYLWHYEPRKGNFNRRWIRLRQAYGATGADGRGLQA